MVMHSTPAANGHPNEKEIHMFKMTALALAFTAGMIGTAFAGEQQGNRT